tara:strand:- start:235 stop:1299 length:1065 start_codon:yes stop_codon:yes gene_type:complete
VRVKATQRDLMADTSGSDSDSSCRHSASPQPGRFKFRSASLETAPQEGSDETDSGDDLLSEISKASVVRGHPRANDVTEDVDNNFSTFIASNVKPSVGEDVFQNTKYNVKDPNKDVVYNIPREMFVHASNRSTNGTVLGLVPVPMSRFSETNATQRLAVAKSLVRQHGVNHIAERLMFIKLRTKPEGMTAFLPVQLPDDQSDPCVHALQLDGGVALLSIPKQEIVSLIQQSGIFPREFACEAGKWTIQNPPYTRESALAWTKIYPPMKRKRRNSNLASEEGTSTKNARQPLKQETVESTDVEWSTMHRIVDSRVTNYYEPPRSEEWKLKGLRVPAGVALKIKIELTPQDADQDK